MNFSLHVQENEGTLYKLMYRTCNTMYSKLNINKLNIDVYITCINCTMYKLYRYKFVHCKLVPTDTKNRKFKQQWRLYSLYN